MATRSIAASQLRIARPASRRLGGGLEQIGVAKFDSPILGGGAENFRRSGAILDLGTPIRHYGGRRQSFESGPVTE
jgi:hypothetical protein